MYKNQRGPTALETSNDLAVLDNSLNSKLASLDSLNPTFVMSPVKYQLLERKSLAKLFYIVWMSVASLKPQVAVPAPYGLNPCV